MPDIVETLESAGGRWKAAIVRRSDGLLQVVLLKRKDEADPGQGQAAESWALQDKSNAFFDDIPAARRAAQELLAAHEGKA